MTSWFSLKVGNFNLSDRSTNEISPETVAILDEINSNTLTISDVIESYDSLKLLTSLKYQNLNIEFSEWVAYCFILVLKSTPILLINSKSEERLYLTWESLALSINPEELNTIFYIKSNKESINDSDWLFIEYSWISKFNISSFKLVLDQNE